MTWHMALRAHYEQIHIPTRTQYTHVWQPISVVRQQTTCLKIYSCLNGRLRLEFVNGRGTCTLQLHCSQYYYISNSRTTKVNNNYAHVLFDGHPIAYMAL